MKIGTIKVITAEEGYRLTDGKIYAKTILLPEGRTADEFTEITDAAYEEIVKEQEKSSIHNTEGGIINE